MKIYRFLHFGTEITCEELEVKKETPKCYFDKCGCRILKADLNMLLPSQEHMYCLTNDKKTYINALIKWYKVRISVHEQSIEYMKDKLKNLEVMLNED